MNNIDIKEHQHQHQHQQQHQHLTTIIKKDKHRIISNENKYYFVKKLNQITIIFFIAYNITLGLINLLLDLHNLKWYPVGLIFAGVVDLFIFIFIIVFSRLMYIYNKKINKNSLEAVIKSDEYKKEQIEDTDNINEIIDLANKFSYTIPSNTRNKLKRYSIAGTNKNSISTIENKTKEETIVVEIDSD